ncbi:4'-phosphopantetheinyl transferase superfamily protein [Streptomyces sp. DG2A-72]|uniref:4'-phosphopantetheinyl transferase family protein n=1 Tax=Streptomyces sp. DG2A-72 TaxID=3051386 RepID=UPI00265C0459|nr:4'-phosphopantetheinyl transferase superfamily protein [Streptomyces sp. DG2A-72]MDO0939346.1 4'-phosphopantetheinyl transferase superfamily protein [Streptomyces sp. DG2A-72]
MIEELLPPGVVAVEAFHDLPDFPLYPEERDVIKKAKVVRRREFATVRWCARRALARLGEAPAPVLPDPHGAPQWPDGIIGSLTHCAGYRAAALARGDDITMIGIDAEPNEPLPAGVLETIALPVEQRLIGELAVSAPGIHWGRLLFSMKETVYKSWYPCTGQRLDFEDATVTFSAQSPLYTARVRIPDPAPHTPAVHIWQGRWLCRGGLLISALTVSRREPARLGARAAAVAIGV